MSLPGAVFLDTSILAGQQYNFHSAALASFIPVAKERKLPLLLPDPTKREIMRQITERSVAALRALEEARRRAPFLAKWEHFPKLPNSRRGDWEVKRVAVAEWMDFLKQFTVVTLGYEAVRLEDVMGWYESVRAPFGPGAKRKEFPDAFAVAALASHGEKTSTYIAVVSADANFKAACESFPYLLHFSSLPALIELLLSADKAVAAMRSLVLADQDHLELAIAEDADSLTFYHNDPKYKEIDDVEIEYATAEDVRIVGLGDCDCTVTFDAIIHYSVKLRWTEYWGYEGESSDDSGSVNDYAPISGTAKLHIKSDRSGIESVTFVELDEAEIEITKNP